MAPDKAHWPIHPEIGGVYLVLKAFGKVLLFLPMQLSVLFLSSFRPTHQILVPKNISMMFY